MTHSYCPIHNDHSHSSICTAMCDTNHTQHTTHSHCLIHNAHSEDQVQFILHATRRLIWPYAKPISIHTALCDSHHEPNTMTHSYHPIHMTICNVQFHSCRHVCTHHTPDMTHSYCPIHNAHSQSQIPFILHYVTHTTNQIQGGEDP